MTPEEEKVRIGVMVGVLGELLVIAADALITIDQQNRLRKVQEMKLCCQHLMEQCRDFIALGRSH